MSVVISSSHRFDRDPEGRVWTSGAFAYPFWRRYAGVFDSVRVVARVRDVAHAPPRGQRADGEGVRFAAVPYYRGPWQYLWRLRRVRRAVRAAVEPGDAILLRVPSEIGACLARLAWEQGLPYAVEVVGDPYEVFAPGTIRHPLRPALRRWMTSQLRSVCAAAHAAAYVTNHALPGRYPCTGVAEVFSDVELPGEAFRPTSRPIDRHGKAFTLVSVGTLEQLYKGPDLLIKAVARCVGEGLDLRLVWVGDGRYRAELERRARDAGIGSRTRFCGQLPSGQAVRAELDEADLFVLASRTEGLPRALVEAMARALPCVGSDVGGIPELLADEDRFPRDDADALAERIGQVLRDPARMARMSARNLTVARRYAEAELRGKRERFYQLVRQGAEGCWKAASAPGGAEGARVVQVTTVPQSLGFLRGHVAFLKARGFEIHAVSSPGELLEDFGARHGVATHAVPMARRVTPVRDLISLWRLGRVLWRVRPHIVHGHTPKGGLLAMVSAWQCRVPVRVYHMHGLPMLTARGLRRCLLWWSERLSCKLAHRVLTVSRSVREIAVAEGLCEPEKLDVLCDGSIGGVDAEGRFNPGRLPASRGSLRQALGIPDTAVVAGFVGRIVRDKGLVELTQAWQKLRADLPDLRLLIVGPFEPQDPLPAACEAALRGDPRIHLAGTARDVVPYYAAMDLLVLPSYREGFPGVVLEAGAMGLPVIASAVPGCVDAVQDGQTGTLVPVQDSGSLAEAIRRYAADEKLRRRHGEAGRRRALDRFRPQVFWEALYQEYRRLWPGRGAAAAGARATNARPSQPSAVPGAVLPPEGNGLG